MNKFIFTILVLLFSAINCFAQNIFGARLAAMGNQYAAVKDNYNFIGNFKKELKSTKPIVAVGYAKYFYNNELSTQNLKFVLPLKNYEFGLSLQRYGITEYNEITSGASLAKNFGDKFSIGLRINYHQLKIENYGSTSGLSVDAGIMYFINEELTFGFNFINPSKQTFAKSNLPIGIPSIVNVGLAYQASNKILIATTLNRNFNEKYHVSLGLDYNLTDIFSLRGGLTMKPFKQYAGVGIEHKKFKLDLAVESDLYLGYSSQIGIAYAF